MAYITYKADIGANRSLPNSNVSSISLTIGNQDLNLEDSQTPIESENIRLDVFDKKSRPCGTFLFPKYDRLESLIVNGLNVKMTIHKSFGEIRVIEFVALGQPDVDLLKSVLAPVTPFGNGAKDAFQNMKKRLFGLQSE